jgi:hypothetical protein
MGATVTGSKRRNPVSPKLNCGCYGWRSRGMGYLRVGLDNLHDVLDADAKVAILVVPRLWIGFEHITDTQIYPNKTSCIFERIWKTKTVNSAEKRRVPLVIIMPAARGTVAVARLEIPIGPS